MKILWSGKPGNNNGELCPGAGAVLGLADVPMSTNAQWQVQSADCDVQLRQVDESPLAGNSHNVLALALPNDLAVGGSFTVTATATVSGAVQTAVLKTSVHALAFTFAVAFPGIPTLEAHPEPTVLRLGGSQNVAAEQCFSARGTVTLTGGCDDPVCAWTQLRLGFAQSCTNNYRINNYSVQGVEVRLPGQQADGTVTPPVRDSFSAADFFACDAWSVTFPSKASPAVTQLRDSPRAGAAWTSPASGNLQFIRMRLGFISWLVLRHDKWFTLFGASAVRYVCHFTWSVAGDVWVTNAVAHTLEGLMSGAPQHSGVSPGRGATAALFGGPYANNSSNTVIVAPLNEQSPLVDLYS